MAELRRAAGDHVACLTSDSWLSKPVMTLFEYMLLHLLIDMIFFQMTVSDKFNVLVNAADAILDGD